MKVVFEFYRIRGADDARAVIGREVGEAVDLDDAIGFARRLSLTLDMPQRPDALSVFDGDGNEFYSGQPGSADTPDERPLP